MPGFSGRDGEGPRQCWVSVWGCQFEVRQILAGVGHSQIGNSRVEIRWVLVRVNGRRFGGPVRGTVPIYNSS